jgi:hypothetical protein
VKKFEKIRRANFFRGILSRNSRRYNKLKDSNMAAATTFRVSLKTLDFGYCLTILGKYLNQAKYLV